MNIYAMTASDEEVSSWAIYCDEEAVIDGKDLGTCLGDLFSINWMSDTVMNIGSRRTLLQQFEVVKEETAENEELDRKGSPVCIYGDMDLQDRADVGEFIGIQPQRTHVNPKTNEYINQIHGYL